MTSRKRAGKPSKQSKGSTKRVSKGAVARTWRFLSIPAVEALHEEALAEHGRLSGIRDRRLLESAIARCQQKSGDVRGATAPQLAASLAFGLAKNHPFHDENKRIALIASFTFLELNGVRMVATEVDAAKTFIALASGELSEVACAKWLASHSRVSRAD